MTYQEWKNAHAFRLPASALETLDRIMVGQDREQLNRAYACGWVEASLWANRDDLLADVDSPAYIDDRESLLDGIGGAA